MSDWIEDIPSAVKGHRKFIEWIIQFMNPNIVVELGVDYGYSTFVISKSLFRLDGKIYIYML